MTIHIVEDDRAVADSLSLVLGQVGHDVSVYYDGATFLAAEISAGDKIILDLRLPDMSGASLFGYSRDRGADVIVMTGLAKASIDRELPDLEPERLVRKPVAPEALIEML